MNRSSASRWVSGNGTLVTSPPVGHRPCVSGWTPRGMATSFRFIGGLDGGLCRGKPRDRHPVRRATDIVKAEGVTEGDGRGIAPMLAADAQLDVRAPLPAPLDRQLHEPPDALLVERGKGIGIEDVVGSLAEPQAAGPALHGLLVHLAAQAPRAAVAAVHVEVGGLRGVVAGGAGRRLGGIVRAAPEEDRLARDLVSGDRRAPEL